MDMVNISKRQPHGDEKCQLKATYGSSMNDRETLTPQGRPQNNIILYVKMTHT